MQKVPNQPLLYKSAAGVYYLRKRTGEIDNDVSLGTTKQAAAVKLRDDYTAARRARKLGLAAPEAEENPKTKAPAKVKCKAVFDRWVADGFPDEDGEPHQGKHLGELKRNLEDLRAIFDAVEVDELDQDKLDDYRNWRRKQVRAVRGKKDGARTVDKELTTFSKALDWALRKKVIIAANPIANRVTYCKSKNVHHCRDYKPESVDELHSIAGKLFANTISEVLGWQALFEGMTGLRTGEILQWMVTDRSDEPGGLTPDGGSLCVRRSKKGNNTVDNPYLPVDPFLKESLDAHRKWHEERYPESPWFFPGLRTRKGAGNGGKNAVSGQALSHKLLRLYKQKKIRKRITSHGLRALYVWVRRSQGADDSLIAHEIGHSSPLMIQRVYGSIPAHWKTGQRPNYSWRPTGPLAWELLQECV